ncbi:hypothetical protein CYY_004125 [Polysphondylium violaceum]|uniref:tRNA pseudouridine synthase n=1 Tax=Polysphondylium violaceum TaxID=133409 RepID=A0A8J4V825_9MYCE|nr:hypothetical protein CYY_004125 [Polysphondylium violaceum]
MNKLLCNSGKSKRYKIIFEYVGSAFSGWQKQNYPMAKPSIQEVIEQALSFTQRKFIPVYGSSRTDSGVSAFAQVAHFNIDGRVNKKGEPVDHLSPESITLLLNHNFKEYADYLRVIKTEVVDETFHSRHNASSRVYLYKVLGNATLRKTPLSMKSNVWVVNSPLDIDAMNDAAQKAFVGRHDFNSFRSAFCQSPSTVRTIDYIKIFELKNEMFDYHPTFSELDDRGRSQYIGIEIKAKSFLQQQVRIMVSCLVDVGKGKLTTEQLIEIRDKKDRQYASATGPAFPLTLVKVNYDKDEYNNSNNINSINNDNINNDNDVNNNFIVDDNNDVKVDLDLDQDQDQYNNK